MEPPDFDSFSREYLIDFASENRENVQEDTITLVGDGDSGEILAFPASRLLAISPLLRSLLPPPCPYEPRNYHVSVPGIPWQATAQFHHLICFGKTALNHPLAEIRKLKKEMLIVDS